MSPGSDRSMARCAAARRPGSTSQSKTQRSMLVSTRIGAPRNHSPATTTNGSATAPAQRTRLRSAGPEPTPGAGRRDGQSHHHGHRSDPDDPPVHGVDVEQRQAQAVEARAEEEQDGGRCEQQDPPGGGVAHGRPRSEDARRGDAHGNTRSEDEVPREAGAVTDRPDLGRRRPSDDGSGRQVGHRCAEDEADVGSQQESAEGVHQRQPQDRERASQAPRVAGQHPEHGHGRRDHQTGRGETDRGDVAGDESHRRRWRAVAAPCHRVVPQHRDEQEDEDHLALPRSAQAEVAERLVAHAVEQQEPGRCGGDQSGATDPEGPDQAPCGEDPGRCHHRAQDQVGERLRGHAAESSSHTDQRLDR